MNSSLDRGFLLLEQNNPGKAEEEARNAIEADVNNPGAYALLALAVACQERFKEALRAAKTGLELNPENSALHYIMGVVLHDMNKRLPARKYVDNAIALDPFVPGYHALSADLYLMADQFPEALEAADRGLECDPVDVDCQNMRSRALFFLGRREEANDMLDATLQGAPENTHTHALRGFLLLDDLKTRQALQHFREAMRLNPEDPIARFGIVQGMKARNPVYHLITRYFWWLNKLRPEIKQYVIIAPLLGLLLFAGQYGDTHMPLVITFGVIYLLCILMVWTADALFNLLLRLDPVGRYVLDAEQKLESLMVGCCILLAAVLALCFFISRDRFTLFAATGAIFLMVPLSRWHAFQAGNWRLYFLRAHIIILCILLLGAIGFFFVDMRIAGNFAAALYGMGLIIFLWTGELI